MPSWFDLAISKILPWDSAEPLHSWARNAITKLAVSERQTIHSADKSGYLTADDHDPFLNKLKGLGGQKIVDNARWEDGILHGTMTWVFPNGLLNVAFHGGHVNVSVHSLDRETVTKVSKICKTFKPISEVRASAVHMLGQRPNGSLHLYNIGVAGKDLEKANYGMSVLSKYTKLVAELKSESPLGRLSILTGPPGTGKTYLIRALIRSVPALWVVIPGGLVGSLNDPSFVPVLLELKEESGNEPIILVIEDGDMALTTRAADNIGSISSLLNASSGIVGDLIDLRVIATTNAKKVNLEPALLRNGRLSLQIDVAPLDADHANRVFQRLAPKAIPTDPYHKPTILADIYAHARANGWTPPPKERSSIGRAIGFQNDIVRHW